ncbi:MAG: putative bifunctional diguanylate cyclase/phosphodiesterase [Thermoanaerobaculia bacterium]
MPDSKSASSTFHRGLRAPRVLRSERLWRATYRISEAAHEAQSLEQLFRALHGIVSELAPARNFYIALHDRERNTLSFPYFVDEVDPTPSPRLLSRGLTEYVLRTGRPLLASPEIFEELVRRGEIEPIGAPSVDWLGVPLRASQETIGVVVVQSYTQGVRFSESDRDLLAFVSTQLAMAIERKAAEERSWHHAHHDGLTGLPNRLLFGDRLGLAIQRARRDGQRLAIMFLDLDDFKHVNDTLGHSAGDELLVEVGERLRRTLRGDDTVARLGGDEFVILLNGAKDAGSAAVMARKILAVFDASFVARKRDLFLSASLGVALCPDDGSDPETLLAHVDTAMYRAKKAGRNTFQFFTPEMQRQAQERASLESGLRRALPRGEMRLHYQPIRELKTGRIAGLEALVRWQHPERGLLPPLNFVPLAEDVGLIVPLGAWVLRRACEQARTWREERPGDLAIAVNLSARQLQQESFAREVRQILHETGLPPTALNLEITESTAMQNVEATSRVLGELSAIGIGLSIDDFGTGHSSLSYLKHFPIHRLKIDRSFIDGMARDLRDRAIVKGVLSIAHSLGVRVVAEGVETEEQASLLTTFGCDEVQGFLFGAPVPESEVGKLLVLG